MGHAEYEFMPNQKIIAYTYWLDFNNIAGFTAASSGLSSKTYGLRLVGKIPVTNDFDLLYVVEGARQHDNGKNSSDYSASYYHVAPGIGWNGFTVEAGIESLSGDGQNAFGTPLATLHAHNGWADKFLSTPNEGLNDAFLGVKGTLGTWKWNVLYHDFSAQAGSQDWGTEFDGSISRKFKDHFGILFKAASFSTDSLRYGDTTKLWVQLTASY